MMGRVYVASRASVPAMGRMWRTVRNQLRGKVEITSSWIDEDGPGQTPSMADLWSRIGDEVRRSDGLVLYVEAAHLPLKGAYVEAGMALILDKRVIVVSPDLDLLAVKARVGSWVMHPLAQVWCSADPTDAVLELGTAHADA
jgi:hypothetical protein